MTEKLLMLLMALVVAGLFIVVVPTAFVQYPLPMQVVVFWVAFGLLADRLTRGKR